MPLMPGFRKHRTDAGYVARIVAGYGELEILFCNSAGLGLAVGRHRRPNHQIGQHRIHYENVARHRIHLERGGKQRLRFAKRLARPAFTCTNLQRELTSVFAAIDHCRVVRNLLAHSSWDYNKKELLFASLEDAAKQGGSQPNINMRRSPRKSLQYVEKYFWETFVALNQLNEICAVRNGLYRSLAPSMPLIPGPMKPHTSLFP